MFQINVSIFLFVWLVLIATTVCDDIHNKIDSNVIEGILREHYNFPKQRSHAENVLYTLCSKNIQILPKMEEQNHSREGQRNGVDKTGHILGFVVRKFHDRVDGVNHGEVHEVTRLGLEMSVTLSPVMNPKLFLDNFILKVSAFALPNGSDSRHDTAIFSNLTCSTVKVKADAHLPDYATSIKSFHCIFIEDQAVPIGELFGQIKRDSFQLQVNYIPIFEHNELVQTWNFDNSIPMCSPSIDGSTALSKKFHNDNEGGFTHHNLIACTQPFKNIDKLEKRWPGIIRQWLIHHIYLMGIGQIYIYDSDGSTQDFIKEFIALGLVKYYGVDFLAPFVSDRVDDIIHEDDEDLDDDTIHIEKQILEDDLEITSQDIKLQAISITHCQWSTKGKTEWTLLSLPSPSFYINDYYLSGKTLFSQLDFASQYTVEITLPIVNHIIRRLDYNYYRDYDSSLRQSIFAVFPYISIVDTVQQSISIVDPHLYDTIRTGSPNEDITNERVTDLSVFIRDYSSISLAVRHQPHTIATISEVLMIDTTMEQMQAFHSLAEDLHNTLLSSTTTNESQIQEIIEIDIEQFEWSNDLTKIRLLIIAPGSIEIPPKGYGAVEIIIWNYYVELNKPNRSTDSNESEFEAIFINSSNETFIRNEIDRLHPNVIHIQLEKWAYLADWINYNVLIILTIHSPYLSNNEILRNMINSPAPSVSTTAIDEINDHEPLEDFNHTTMDTKTAYEKAEETRLKFGVTMTVINVNAVSIAYRCHDGGNKLNNHNKPNIVFFLINEKHRDTLSTIWHLPIDRMFIIPNGVEIDKYAFVVNPLQSTSPYANKSVSLGKIDARKRQYYVQSILNEDEIRFIGPPSQLDIEQSIKSQTYFNFSSLSYLGSWDKTQLYHNLTYFANLVHLATDEGAPLAVVEAMAAGLGVVITSSSTANLDLTKPFITVIPDDRLDDKEYIASEIRRNRVISMNMRSEIRQYAREHFSWSEAIVPKYKQLIRKLLVTNETKEGLSWAKKYRMYQQLAYPETIPLSQSPPSPPYLAVVSLIDSVTPKLRQWLDCLRLLGVELVLIYTFPILYQEKIVPMINDYITEGFVEIQFITNYSYYNNLLRPKYMNQSHFIPNDKQFLALIMNEAVSYFRLRGITWMVNLFEQDYIYIHPNYSSIIRDGIKVYLAQQDIRNIDVIILIGNMLQKANRNRSIEIDSTVFKTLISRSFVRVNRIVYHGLMGLYCIDRQHCCIESTGDANGDSTHTVYKDIGRDTLQQSPISLLALTADYANQLKENGTITSVDDEMLSFYDRAIGIFPVLAMVRDLATLPNYETNRQTLMAFITVYRVIDNSHNSDVINAFCRLAKRLVYNYALIVYTDVVTMVYLNNLLCPHHKLTALDGTSHGIVCTCFGNIIFINLHLLTTTYEKYVDLHRSIVDKEEYQSNVHPTRNHYSAEYLSMLLSKVDYMADARSRYPHFAYYAYIDFDYALGSDSVIPVNIDQSRLLPNKIMCTVRNLPDAQNQLSRVDLLRSEKVFVHGSAFIVPNLLMDVLHDEWHVELGIYHQEDLIDTDEAIMYRIMINHPSLFVYIHAFPSNALFSSYLNSELVFSF